MREIILGLSVREDIMIESTIPLFPSGGGDRMSGSTSLSRHRGMTDTLLDIEMIREDYTTMIDGARSRVLISHILMEEIPMIGSAGQNISSMSTRCHGRQGSEWLAFTWRVLLESGG